MRSFSVYFSFSSPVIYRVFLFCRKCYLGKIMIHIFFIVLHHANRHFAVVLCIYYLKQQKKSLPTEFFIGFK
jgi:hypothetical protein